MNFVSIDSESFRKFAEKSPYKSFMQTPEIAKNRESDGWTSYYFAATNEDTILGAAMLVAKPTFLGKSTFISPGGPLLDYENTTLVNFFFSNLIKYIKNHNGYTLHIDPYYKLIERDRNGEIVEGGYNHEKATRTLRSLGFKPNPGTGQPKYLFALSLEGQTENQIFTDMKRNTRNHIRKAEKQGVKIRELKREELKVFKDITESTSARRNFTDKPLDYYEKMYDLFYKRGEVKFLLAEAKIDGKMTPLSSAMFMLYGDEIIYLFSGSDEKYMKEYNAQYLIQWHMIKYGLTHKFKVFNFYGINGLPDKSSKDYGIYDFKKGFTSESTGRVIELLGSYEISTNATFGFLHSFLRRIKHH